MRGWHFQGNKDGIFKLAKKLKAENVDIAGDKCVRNDTRQVSYTDEAKLAVGMRRSGDFPVRTGFSEIGPTRILDRTGLVLVRDFRRISTKMGDFRPRILQKCCSAAYLYI